MIDPAIADEIRNNCIIQGFSNMVFDAHGHIIIHEFPSTVKVVQEVILNILFFIHITINKIPGKTKNKGTQK